MFSYLGVLISVVMGLALTHVLRGLSKLIQTRGSVRIYWVHVIWSINIVLYVLGLWWGMYGWNKLQVWTTELFLFLTLYAIVVFVMASLLFPAEFHDDMDFEEYFYRNRGWFFGLLAIALVFDIPETLLKESMHLRDVPKQYMYFLPSVLGMSLVAAWSSSRLVQGVLCVAWSFAILLYMNFSALEHMVGP